MRSKKLLTVVFLVILFFGMFPLTKHSEADFEYILRTGTIPPWHYENGTEIPPPSENFCAYITVYQYGEGYKFRYNPDLETLELNLSGIWIDPTPMERNGDEYTVHGYVTFYAEISQEFPKPKQIFETFENGTTKQLPFSVEERTFTFEGNSTTIPIWYVEFTVYFSNPLVTIYGERPTAKLLIAIGLILAVLVAIAYFFKKRRSA